MTTPNPALRERYLGDTVNTASPGRLLVMLYDRLVLDLKRGEQAFAEGNREEGSRQLLHAQEIIMELRASLDTAAWGGGPGLASLYGFLLTELVGANIGADAERVATCRGIVEPLRDAWREAATAAETLAAV
jgi:flagellar secretion chaperone FliS